MIEQIIHLLAAFWHRLTPFFIVPIYETAGILRLGAYHRTAKSGELNFKLPIIEEVHAEYSVPTTLRLEPQTCTTKDSISVVVVAVVKWQIEDIQAFICGVYDAKDALTDIAMGAVRTAVHEVTFDELTSDPPESKIAIAVRRQVKKWGLGVERVTFTDIGKVRSLRLIQHAVAHAVTPLSLAALLLLSSCSGSWADVELVVDNYFGVLITFHPPDPHPILADVDNEE